MERIQISKRIVREYFKNDIGQPFELSDGQAEIFASIFFKDHPRVQVIASTQYGKSETIAMAIILRTQTFSEDFAIVTGSQPKSDIIMEKVIKHTFDDKRLFSQLEIDRTEGLERIKRERSRKRLTWRCGGGVRTYTADSRNRRRVIDSLTGLGSANIVEDEASLIPDDLQSMLLRMLGGHGGGFLLKIGNPFTNGHFKRTWHSEKYKKIFINYHQGMREGRYTEEFIDEMKNEAFFQILYECKFPDEKSIDTEGYYRLLTDDEIDNAKAETPHGGIMKLGFDIGEGGDENVGIIRSGAFAQIVHRSRVSDLMATTRTIADLLKRYKIEAGNCFIDANGIGAGVEDRLKEIGLKVRGVKWSESGGEKFQNLKAKNFWDAREWIQSGGKLSFGDEWNELTLIKYKEDTSGKLKIKPKEEMRKEGIASPNIADAFALTFNKTVAENAPRIIRI